MTQLAHRLSLQSLRGGSDWTPAELSNLLVWVRSDDLGAVDSLVGTWADRSGNGADFVQATESAKPIVKASIDGHKAARFDGVNDYMDATVTYSQPYFLGVVFTQLAASYEQVCGGNNTPSPAGVDVDAAGKIIIDAGTNVTGTTTRSPTTHTLFALYNGASSDFVTGDSETVSGNAGTNGGTLFRIGRRVTSYGNVDILEYFTCSSDQSAAERAAISAYFASRYPSAYS